MERHVSFPISFTHTEFPSSLKSYEELRTPLGCLVKPLANLKSDEILKLQETSTPGQSNDIVNVARCSNCKAYLNPFCEVSALRWFCAICGHRNAFSRQMVNDAR
jgi:hypothetical protein